MTPPVEPVKDTTIGEIGAMCLDAATSKNLAEAEARRLLALAGMILTDHMMARWQEIVLDKSGFSQRLKELFP